MVGREGSTSQEGVESVEFSNPYVRHRRKGFHYYVFERAEDPLSARQERAEGEQNFATFAPILSSRLVPPHSGSLETTPSIP